MKTILINRPFFISALLTILLGYVLMAMVNLEWIRLTLSPILIVLGFALVVVSIFKPAKK